MTYRPSVAHLAPPIAVALLAALAAIVVGAPRLASVAALALAIAASSIAFARSRRAVREIAIVEGGMAVDGEGFAIATVWLSRDWLVMRGRRAGRRVRVSIHRSDVEDVLFARLRRLAIATVPRINRPRVAASRADR